MTCAEYSIDFAYWTRAGTPGLIASDDVNHPINSYKKCMKNENCILNTLVQYADAVGHKVS